VCLKENQYFQNSNVQIQNGTGNIALSMSLSIYILVALYSVFFSYRRLNRPGVSKEIRMMFIKKHFFYVIVFIVIWVIQLSQNYVVIFNPQTNQTAAGEINQ